MRKKTILIIILLIFLVFSDMIKTDKIYEETSRDENTSILEADFLLEKHNEDIISKIISPHPKNIFPAGEILEIDLKIKNYGSSESGKHRVEIKICKPPDCDAKSVEENDMTYHQYKIFKKINPGETITLEQLGGIKLEEEGSYKLCFEFTEQHGLPGRCDDINNREECEYSFRFLDNKRCTTFQAVSLNDYYSIVTNMNIERLTVIIIILTIVSIKKSIIIFIKKYI